MRLSLAVGLLMLDGKWYAYSITNSTAILSDAAESVVHVAAVAFAVFSLWLSLRPADDRHLYGHDKISFFFLVGKPKQASLNTRGTRIIFHDISLYRLVG